MRISDWSSDVCSSDLHVTTPSPPPLPPSQRVSVHRATDAVERAHHFALDASHTRSGAPRDLGVAQVIDPVREEHIACEPGKREKRSEEHTSELQSLMRISYAVFCLKKKRKNKQLRNTDDRHMSTSYI